MADVDVRTGYPYSVSVEDGFDCFHQIRAIAYGSKAAIITDSNVVPLYGDSLDAFLPGREVLKIVISAGEAHKSPVEYIDILNRLAAAHFTRNDTVIALGGGVVGDLAGFVASTYMRGIRLIAVPTSLLAMVDSSVGGKTAINLQYGKNLCGTFYQPLKVFINTQFLSTLPEREWQCGWGEIIKYAFLSDTVTLADLEGGVSADLIARCVRIKADIVAADEREQGVRKLLNLGHTVGHAIERLSDFALSHGECVIKGLASVLEMSRRYYSLSDAAYRKAHSMIAAKGHDLTNPFTREEIMAQLLSDKKSNATGTSMVLIDGDLKGKIVYLPYDDIRNLLP
jgi:3-dehydroquinate synthase